MYLVEFPISKIAAEVEALTLVGKDRQTDSGFIRGAEAALVWMREGGLSPSQQLIQLGEDRNVG
jgi:hypothetical protein